MLWIIIAALAILADQFSKYIVLQSISSRAPLTVIRNFFYLDHHENTGAAWGILQNNRIFLIIVPAIAVAVIIYQLVKSRSKLYRLSLTLIMGGAVGNLIDRVWKGSVTDFLSFKFGSYYFPTFNVADICVVVGTAFMVYYVLFIYKEEERQTVD